MASDFLPSGTPWPLKTSNTPTSLMRARSAESAARTTSPAAISPSITKAKSRLTALISGFETERREAFQRAERLEFASETLRFHLEQMERVQTAGLSRTGLIRELERGLVALDAAERDLERESGRADLPRRSGSESSAPLIRRWLTRGGKFAMTQVLAFLLPLLFFVVAALILIGTALGWF